VGDRISTYYQRRRSLGAGSGDQIFCQLYRRKLKLKAKFERDSSYVSLKR
jgi:hypothetical protein